MLHKLAGHLNLTRSVVPFIGWAAAAASRHESPGAPAPRLAELIVH
jgi:hypothetical protein